MLAVIDGYWPGHAAESFVARTFTTLDLVGDVKVEVIDHRDTTTLWWVSMKAIFVSRSAP